MSTIPNKTVVITDTLPCALTDEEVLKFAGELANANKEVDRAIDEKKFLTQQATSKVKKAEAYRDEITSIVASRTEWREVTVNKVYDYEKGIVTETRTDTGEVIASRALSDEEKQTKLIEDEPSDE